MASVVRRIIKTTKAPMPEGVPYNQAIVHNDTVYLSGVIGIAHDLKLVPGGAASEARQALTSIGHILEAAGTSYENVIKASIFLNDINTFNAVNEVYVEFFPKNFPARSTYQVGKLPMGANVEIEVIAALNKNPTMKL